MKVFVLMADGGYDGDALLGVYATRDKAREAAAALAEYDKYFKAEETYIEAIEIDGAARERQTGIGRSNDEEHRRRMVQQIEEQEPRPGASASGSL